MAPRKRVKLKITGKILVILLGLSLISLFVSALVAMSYMASLGRSAMDSTASLGASAIKDSTTALTKQAEDQLITLAANQAAISNAMFDKVESGVSIVAGRASVVMGDPALYRSGTINPQSQKPSNIYATSVGIPPPGSHPELADDELKLLSNLDSTFIQVLQSDRNVTQLFVSSESGCSRLYPWASGIPDGFDPRLRNWYVEARAARSLGWTSTETDSVSGRTVITCYKPVYGRDGQLLAVAGADITIQTINQGIINTQISNNGYAFLLDGKGKLLAHPSMQIKGKRWDEAVESGNLLNSRDPALLAIANDMVAGNTGVARCMFDNSEKFIAYSPIQRTGWSIGIAMPVDEIVAPVESTRERINSATQTFAARTDAEIRNLLLALAATSLGIILAVAGVAFFLARRITHPILVLNSGARSIGQGNLDMRLDVQTGDELQDLAEDFNKMAADLKEYIKDLQETTSAKERIESELRVAQEIQASMLPRLFPPFPDRKEFDLHAIMVPAREVGGDFYDFFFTRPDTLCIIIGDVCGKGIPAALFMAICKTLLRTEALHLDKPEDVLFHVNNILYPDNEASMFVTVLCVLLNTLTGELTIANGGHNPPLICPSSEGFHYVNLARGLVVGAMEDTKYNSSSFKLAPGDMLVMYTDGVTEAMNGESSLYSESRLLAALDTLKNEYVGEVIQGVKADIDIFAGGTAQSDDITMIVLRYHGPDLTQT